MSESISQAVCQTEENGEKSLAMQAAEMVIKAGSMLLIAGAEVYRVEETMQRLGMSVPGIKQCNSYVSATGIICTVCTETQMATKVARIYSGSRNLSIVNAINALSRQSVISHYSVEQIEQKLTEIGKIPAYSTRTRTIFGAIGAAGFAVFFWGSLPDVIASFLIGIVIHECGQYLSKLRLNQFLVIMVQSFAAAALADLAYDLSALRSQHDYHFDSDAFSSWSFHHQRNPGYDDGRLSFRHGPLYGIVCDRGLHCHRCRTWHLSAVGDVNENIEIIRY